ncbi:MAG: SH3 domain-containing protein [Spirochaetales bacterium]|nr:SH3 domain-containing protein [Spirochaetales bacterium]
MKNTIISLFIIIALFSSLSSCKRKEEISTIPLPATPAFTIGTQWGVITSHFLRLRKNPDSKARILTHLRKGTLVEIMTKSTKREKIEGQDSYWYQINYNGLKGWIFGGYLKEFNSKNAALEYAKELK